MSELHAPPSKTVNVAVSAHALQRIEQNPKIAEELAACATSFRAFLPYWHFLDQETGKQRKLGNVLWPGQEEFVETMALSDFIYALKARKLGFTTLEQAYDGWVARFRSPNERVHMFSRREESAQEILRNVKYGLDRLPDWMRLPYGKNTAGELHLIAGEDDTRILKAYPADEETAVEATCTHGHVDEWARMRNPRKVWQAIEPSMAGTCHIITTGLGPGNFASTFWLMTMNGDTPFKPFFVNAIARPGRTMESVLAKRKSMPEVDARREYPLDWKDSLYAGADLLFSGEHLENCGNSDRGRQPAQEGHIYVKSWDIGRHRDAAVGTVFDMSVSPPEVVNYYRLRGIPYPSLQAKIEQVHQLYPPVRVRGSWKGKTVVEKNSAGEAVLENLNLPEDEIEGFSTTGPSKARMISSTQIVIQNEAVRYDKREFPELHNELDAYQLPDDNLVQDSVMSFMIGLDTINADARAKPKKGRARAILL